jgi:hypothetical protein
MNDVDRILDKIRDNSTILANYHRKRYLVLKTRLKYYRCPIIVISALNSVGAVSLQGFLGQTYISLINMFLSLIVGIIGSLEMFFKISEQMTAEDAGSREFYLLSVDIYKYLALDRKNRITEEKAFLSECWSRYTKLIETSYVLKKKVEDKLSKLPDAPPAELFVDTSSEEDNGSP